MTARYDAVVVGAGFGGLGTALRLAERGARVCVLEALAYPGGCASTFRREGHRFESGATLFSGFGEGQLFRTWIDRHGIDVELDWLDPVVDFRAPGLQLDVPPRRDELVGRFLALPGAPRTGLRSFFAEQRRVADLLWGVLDEPGLMPPIAASGWFTHLRRLPRYGVLLRSAGRPLIDVLRRHGVDGFEPLVTFADALCQITVQCGVREAEAPLALSTMDYYFRGTAHVRGGIGELAWGLVRAIRGLGGEVRMASAARGLERRGDVWRVGARRGDVEAPVVVANVLPHTVRRLLGEEPGTRTDLDRRAADVEQGWGACMLYLVLRSPPGADPSPRHIEIVQDPALPLVEGNHLFCSIGGAHDTEEGGCRTATVSTHVPVDVLRSLDEAGQAAYVAGVQETMRAGLRRFAPEWWAGVEREMTASPRTFERFTGRPHGYVGGVPRRAGWHNYRRLSPRPVLPGVYLVGDSVFPGQSTLATALGGLKLADHVGRRLPEVV